MPIPQKLHKARNDTTLDNALDRWILLFGEQLAELGCRVQLALGIVRENTRNHLLRELQWVVKVNMHE